ncbi:phospholysine phosphohistidine inorganic pyrophosphate phosphatase isoform X1 [Aphelocoma coerulescens]|uniref:phospholysine phosphohistidine inorganic pyrophosphate phosphatase isoform X1 n=1 Tax=Aphelocoma coerulescens TaxID=39617 RepID=UPI003604C517
MAGWGWARAVRGLLLDVSGVLYDSGADGGVPIAGSAEAVRRIKASGLKLQLCTNETQATRENFVRKLRAMGFDVSVAEVTAPAPAACHLLKERGLRPHLLVHDDLIPEFAEIDKTNPNCVVLGDAAENFTYANLNKAFQLLIEMEKPVLISLGKGRYYKETDGLKLDVGAYMKALEYACDIQAEVVGKPAKRFFESALAELGVPPEQAIMIGDDIVSDVGGAQQCGMRALQVRTGKYRFSWTSVGSQDQHSSCGNPLKTSAAGSPTASMDPAEHHFGQAAFPSLYPTCSIQLQMQTSPHFVVSSRAAGPRPWSHHSSRWHQRQLVPLQDPAPRALFPQFNSPQPHFPTALEQMFL